MARNQRKYNTEYKVQAVKLSNEIGSSKAAVELGRLDIGGGAHTPQALRQNLDIAMINKFYDLATMQPALPETIQSHYEALDHHASECIGSRACEPRCPFGVKIAGRMSKASAVFGK